MGFEGRPGLRRSSAAAAAVRSHRAPWRTSLNERVLLLSPLIWLKQEQLLFISHGKLMHNVILGKEITYCTGGSGSRCVRELRNDQTSLSKVSGGSSRRPLWLCIYYAFPRRLPPAAPVQCVV